MPTKLAQASALDSLPYRLVHADFEVFSVPKYITRNVSGSYKGWRVTPGPSGIFVEDAKACSFNDRQSPAGMRRAPAPAASLKEAMAYLGSIYQCPAARPTATPRGEPKRFMPAGLRLQLRRPAYRANHQGTWVIVVTPSKDKTMPEKREYVVVGADGSISQEQFVNAMKSALVLRADRLIQRAKAHAMQHQVTLTSNQILRPAKPVLAMMTADLH